MIGCTRVHKYNGMPGSHHSPKQRGERRAVRQFDADPSAPAGIVRIELKLFPLHCLLHIARLKKRRYAACRLVDQSEKFRVCDLNNAPVGVHLHDVTFAKLGCHPEKRSIARILPQSLSAFIYVKHYFYLLTEKSFPRHFVLSGNRIGLCHFTCIGSVNGEHSQRSSGKAHRADDIISLNCDEVINVAKKRHFVTMAT